jgi:glucosamine-6-phosphate deaminase
LDNLPEDCNLKEGQVLFPNEHNIEELDRIIKNGGGIDTCFGGIGIHGHVAFNEPERGVKESSPRKVKLNNFTITINAIRAHVGGNVENFPRHAYTLGMNQILNSKKIRLYCRNGSPYDWANTVLRLALFGTPNYDYPVTYIRNHPDYQIITDRDTLKTPQNII